MIQSLRSASNTGNCDDGRRNMEQSSNCTFFCMNVCPVMDFNRRQHNTVLYKKMSFVGLYCVDWLIDEFSAYNWEISIFCLVNCLMTYMAQKIGLTYWDDVRLHCQLQKIILLIIAKITFCGICNYFTLFLYMDILSNQQLISFNVTIFILVIPVITTIGKPCETRN